MEKPTHNDINDNGSDDEGCPSSTTRRRGLGQGGAKAKYCGQMTPQTRLSTMASSGTNVEMFDVRLTDSGGEKIWCLCCGKPVFHEQLTFMKSHMSTQGHKKNLDMWQKRRQKQKEVAAENIAKLQENFESPPKMQRVLTGKQPKLQHAVDLSSARYAVADDTVFTFLATGIPFEKLDHPVFRAWLRKHTDVSGCIPTLSGNFPAVNVIRVYDSMVAHIGNLLIGKPLCVVFDEWTDSRGVANLGIMVHSTMINICLDVMFLEGHGPKNGVEHKEVAAQVIMAFSKARLQPDQVQFVFIDEGSVLVAAWEHILQPLWSNAIMFLCWAHTLHGVGDVIREDPKFVESVDVLLRSPSLVRPETQAARRRRWVLHRGTRDGGGGGGGVGQTPPCHPQLGEPAGVHGAMLLTGMGGSLMLGRPLFKLRPNARHGSPKNRMRPPPYSIPSAIFLTKGASVHGYG